LNQSITTKEKRVATIHSTIISGAGASSALLPLLAGKTSILLVTDKNVGALEATQAIHRLLAAEGRVVEVIDTVPAEPSHHDVAQIVSQLGASQPQMVVGIGGERTGCSKTAVSTSAP
jgi:alcohol dehydrogenase class IV